MTISRSLSFGLCLTACSIAKGQQVPDSAFNYQPGTPAYAPGKGPVILLDEAHFNFHTLSGRYQSFGKVLASDGYVLRPGMQKFTQDYLEQARILVIANALPDSAGWTLPTPAAFTREEVAAVKQWVNDGGSLFLIADHMPFAGAAARLGRAFGLNWINGYAMRDDGAPELYSRRTGNLAATAITDGASAAERIDSITLFTGSAFLPPPDAVPITTLNDDYSILLPSVAGQFSDSTAYIDGRYMANGAMLAFGKGRVVAFAEAAMFTAQLQGPDRLPMGMNQKGAGQNPRLLLNVIHWLDHRQ